MTLGLPGLRDAYAIAENSLKDPERVRLLNAFFFWTSWTCVTQRPGQDITYTNNWPAEELVGNRLQVRCFFGQVSVS